MGSPVQLRGDVLKSRISDIIEQVARDGVGLDKRGMVSMSLLAKMIPCLKTTLYKHVEFVQRTISLYSLQASQRDGSKKWENSRALIDRQAAEIFRLKNELNALRLHHANLYAKLLRSSFELRELVADAATDSSLKDKKCIFCGAEGDGCLPSSKVHKL